MLYTRKQVCLGTIFYTGPSSGLLYIVLPLSITPAFFFFCARSDLALPERALRRSILQSRTQVRSCRLSLAKHARLCEIAPDSGRLGLRQSPGCKPGRREVVLLYRRLMAAYDWRALRRSILQSRTQVRSCRLSLAKHARLCEIAPDSGRLGSRQSPG